jgi:hypothetical protein
MTKCKHKWKKIPKKMKADQHVIYASAEHTLSDGDMDFCDPMFGGVYCCQDCYEEHAGHKVARKLAVRATIDKVLISIDKAIDITERDRRLLKNRIVKLRQ